VLTSRLVLSLFLCVAAIDTATAGTCDLAKAPAVPVIKTLPYVQARQALLAAGWQPVAGHPHNDLSANESTFRDRGFTELQFCRMTADSLCRFEFTESGFTLWLSTNGDEDATLQTQAMVKAAVLACAGDPDPGP
jgi:hypothetical protein